MGESITIDTTGGRIPAYRADPEGRVRGAVLLIHEVWGLVAHIRDVADRFAAEGYLTVAPDILSNAGVPPEVGAELQSLVFSADEAARVAAQPRMREALSVARSPDYAEWATGVLVQVVDYLDAQSGGHGRIAAVGFCFGGTYVYAVAAEDTRIRAAVPFYGTVPEEATLGDIRCPVLAFYGERDERLTSRVPEYEAAMTAAGVAYTPIVYPGVGHAFFNDTNPTTYSEDAAADAWRRTLDFLDG
jgi:carboxymethylenebutenolidase